MATTTPSIMRAVVLDRFGGTEELKVREVPVPEVEADEVLIRLESAGIGSWDPFEREGGYAQMLGTKGRFPYVLGSEGAGAIAALGAQVSGFKRGDRVYAAGFLNPKGGFYAEYVVVKAGLVSMLPEGLTLEQGAVVAGVGLTALRGLDDELKLKSGESILIFGASGGIGHLAVQMAKRMGARVLAVASGPDGVALAQRLGADVAVDGRKEDLSSGVETFGPTGVDAAFLTAGGAAAKEALSAVRHGGRVAYPNGIQPAPETRSGVRITSYNGEPDSEILRRLTRLIEAGLIEVHIAHTFALEQAAEAHRALKTHYLGKLALRVA